MESPTLAREILGILEDAKAADVRCFDVRGKSSVTDFNVLATGSSAPHLRAIVSDVRSRMRERGVPGYRTCGEPGSGWVVMDYLDVIVHVFTPDAREYYDLDGLWKDSPEIAAEQQGGE